MDFKATILKPSGINDVRMQTQEAMSEIMLSTAIWLHVLLHYIHYKPIITGKYVYVGYMHDMSVHECVACDLCSDMCSYSILILLVIY